MSANVKVLMKDSKIASIGALDVVRLCLIFIHIISLYCHLHHHSGMVKEEWIRRRGVVYSTHCRGWSKLTVLELCHCSGFLM